MACPYFMPTSRSEERLWAHPERLPLGGGWTGCCTAPGHEGAVPSSDELKDGCNLGYARRCPRLPRERAWDAVRFALGRERAGRLQLTYVCEFQYRPGEQGTLEYDGALGRWIHGHPDARIQKMAECYLESCLRGEGREI